MLSSLETVSFDWQRFHIDYDIRYVDNGQFSCPKDRRRFMKTFPLVIKD